MYKRQFISLLLLIALLTACTVLKPISENGTTMSATIPAAEATSAAVAAPAAANDQSSTEYVDPAGRFRAPVPTNWTATQQEGYARFASPKDGILIYLLAMPAESGEAAIATGWQLVDPAFAQPVDETIAPPPTGGVEALTLITYEFDEVTERFYQGVARLYDGTYYLLLINGNVTDLQQRQAQISIIDSGLTISALETVDLSGVEPLRVGEVITELASFVEEGLTLFGLPGAAVAIVQDGEVVYSNGFGVTEQGGDTPITPQTHMMIGSTGKSLTTMLMGTLVDAGAMTWDTPVIDLLPQFAVRDPELTASITVRNLVCACTGVPRRDYELFFNANELSAEDLVASLATFEFFTDFGEAFQYSNQLVATGGYAAAAADGADFGNLLAGYSQSLQEHVLTPIGMTNTTLAFAEVQARNNYAMPHNIGIDGTYKPLPLAFEEILVPIAPAGAHWSTLEDMTRYLLTELAVGVAPDGTRVVSAANLRETWQPHVPVSADMDYGLGWFVSDYKGLQLIDHGGNTLGFTSSFGFLPEVDLGIIVLSNGQGANTFTDSVRARLLELIFQQAPEAAANMAFVYEQIQNQLALTTRLRDAVDPATVEPYLGTYNNPALGALELRLEGDVLLADVGEFVVPLLPLEEENEPDTLAGYMATEAPIIGLLFELSEDAAGAPVVKFGQGAEAYTFAPAP